MTSLCVPAVAEPGVGPELSSAAGPGWGGGGHLGGGEECSAEGHQGAGDPSPGIPEGGWALIRIALQCWLGRCIRVDASFS